MIYKKILINLKTKCSKIGDFLDNKGFYIVILLCLIVIGTTIAIVTVREYRRSNKDYVLDNGLFDQKLWEQQGPASSLNENLPKSDVKPVNKVLDKQSVNKQSDKQYNLIDNNKAPRLAAREDKNISLKEKNTVEKTSDKKDKVNLEAKIVSPVPLPKKKVDLKEEQPFKLLYPVFGKVINPYAEDKLIFSKTLQQWTTHEGIDIESERGTPVRAAMDGIVKSVKNDPRYGITIIIDHENGFKTVYSNLSTDKMVEINQFVKKGTVISGIGDTANFEIEDPSHLHFEVLKEGENIDPMLYLSR